MAHPPADHQRPVILCVGLAPQLSQDSPAQRDRIPQSQMPHDRWSIPAARAGRRCDRRDRSSPRWAAVAVAFLAAAGRVRPSRVVGGPDPNLAVGAGGRTRPGMRARRRPPQTAAAGPRISAGLGLVPSSTARRRRHAWPAARLIHHEPCGKYSGSRRATACGSDGLRFGLLLQGPPGLQHRLVRTRRKPGR